MHRPTYRTLVRTMLVVVGVLIVAATVVLMSRIDDVDPATALPRTSED